MAGVFLLRLPGMDYNNPNVPDPYVSAMDGIWQTIEDVTTGVTALANNTYLPIRPLEHEAIHELRKKLADFLPFYTETVEACTGLIFRDEPTLGDDVPERIRGIEADEEKGVQEVEGWWENLDNAGTHGNVFLTQAADIAIRFGHCVILVENMPRLGEGADYAQERASGRRPYCVKYKPSQVRHPSYVLENGRWILEQITFCETVTERKGRFGKEEVKQYRTFTRINVDGNPRVFWVLERQVGKDENRQDGLQEGDVYTVDEGETGLTEIPVAVIYGGYTAPLQSRPPFEGLLHLNLSHFRKLADYNYNISRLQWSLLVGIGVDDKKSIIPRMDGVVVAPAGSMINYVAPPAESANVAFADLERLEKRMASFGLQVLLGDEASNKTATEVETDHATRTSKLSTIVKSVKDAAERILYFMALYSVPRGEQVTSGGSITIGGDVDDLALTPQELDTMLRAADAGKLPRLTWLQLVAPLVQKQVPDFDPEAAEKELQGLEESANREMMRDGNDTEETQTTRQSESDNEDGD